MKALTSRVEIVQQLLTMGVISTPDEYDDIERCVNLYWAVFVKQAKTIHKVDPAFADAIRSPGGIGLFVNAWLCGYSHHVIKSRTADKGGTDYIG
jgi:hypothetical protein